MRRATGQSILRCSAQRTNVSRGVRQELIAVASEVAGTAVSLDIPLMSAGLDSIAATELSTRLSVRLNTEVPQTLLFDHPSLRSMSGSPCFDGTYCSVEARPQPSKQEAQRAPAMRRFGRATGTSATAAIVATTILTVLGTSVKADTPLMSAGLDSLAATELANALSQSVGEELP